MNSTPLGSIVIQLATFGAPCGATFFANVLLELGFHVYNTPFGPWYDRKNKRIVDNSNQLERSVGIPFFLERPLRPPHRATEIAWSHLWATPGCIIAPTIIGIRDPRQALFSQWRRVKKSGRFSGTYRQFLESPYYHLGLSPIDEYIVWHTLWLIRPGDRDFVLRFEAAKETPIDEFGRLLRWMDQSASSESIAEAASRSSVTEARAADPTGAIVIKGALRDYEQHSNAEIEALFSHTAIPLFERLEIPPEMRDLSSAIDALIARFGPPKSQLIVDMARLGLFFDMRNAFKRKPPLGPLEMQLKVALDILERLYISPIFPYFNHADPTLLPAAAVVFGTLARSATPHLQLSLTSRTSARSSLRRVLDAARRVIRI